MTLSLKWTNSDEDFTPFSIHFDIMQRRPNVNGKESDQSIASGLWEISKDSPSSTKPLTAKIVLYLKENIEKHIGLIKVGDTTDDINKLEIRDWAKGQRLDAVIWTALGSKFGESENAPDIDEAVNYLKTRSVQEKKHAEEYVRRTPRQIDTVYRQRFEKEFNWTHLE